MIIKAEVKSKPKIGNIFVKQYIPKDKRYLICINPNDESKVAYVYDMKEDRIVYKIVAKKEKTIESIYEEIYTSYKRSDTRIVEPNLVLSIINELPSNKRKETLLENSLKIHKEAEVLVYVPKQESLHIRRVKDTYRFIDKYKVKLDLEIVKKTSQNSATVFLYDEAAGIDRGVHRIEYDYDKEEYRYYFMNRLVIKSNNLEDIYK